MALKNIFKNFDATKNQRPGASKIVGRGAGPKDPNFKPKLPSYEPNTEEDMFDATVILNEMMLKQELRLNAARNGF